MSKSSIAAFVVGAAIGWTGTTAFFAGQLPIVLGCVVIELAFVGYMFAVRSESSTC